MSTSIIALYPDTASSLQARDRLVAAHGIDPAHIELLRPLEVFQEHAHRDEGDDAWQVDAPIYARALKEGGTVLLLAVDGSIANEVRTTLGPNALDVKASLDRRRYERADDLLPTIGPDGTATEAPIG